MGVTVELTRIYAYEDLLADIYKGEYGNLVANSTFSLATTLELFLRSPQFKIRDMSRQYLQPLQQ